MTSADGTSSFSFTMVVKACTSKCAGPQPFRVSSCALPNPRVLLDAAYVSNDAVVTAAPASIPGGKVTSVTVKATSASGFSNTAKCKVIC